MAEQGPATEADGGTPVVHARVWPVAEVSVVSPGRRIRGRWLDAVRPLPAPVVAGMSPNAHSINDVATQSPCAGARPRHE